MKHLCLLAACAALALSSETQALGAAASVTLVDRDTGAALPTYYYHGEYWVAGTPGARYAIEISNRTAGRLLAVTSVDGVNVLSGATAAWDQEGYVFDPGEGYQISGWRKSNTEVAAFTFTAFPNSYAARTGRPQNIGVIGVALFRERAPRYIPPRITQSPAPRREDLFSAESAPAAGAPAPAEPEARAGIADERAPQAVQGGLQAYTSPLGTGHGAREYSYVQDTEFHRLQSEPNEVIRIRYDSMEHLVAMGVVHHPRTPWPAPSAFPGSQGREFVPDPAG